LHPTRRDQYASNGDIGVARLDRGGDLLDCHGLHPHDRPVPLRRAATPPSQLTVIAKNLRRSPRLS
jgi:hypothetical protein